MSAPEGPGFIYFLYSPLLDRVKIGKTKSDPLKRLSVLRVGSPDQLIVLMVLYTEDMILEMCLHSFASSHRSHGEWFDLTPSLPALGRAFPRWTGETEVVAGISQKCPMADQLVAMTPKKWRTQNRTVHDILPEEGRAGRPWVDYARHTGFRLMVKRLPVGGVIVTEDPGEKSASYMIAKNIGHQIAVKKDQDSDRWTITRTA